jgi:hypothetical protein
MDRTALLVAAAVAYTGALIEPPAVAQPAEPERRAE